MINRILRVSFLQLVSRYYLLSMCFSIIISSNSTAQNLGGTPVNIGINASVYANQTAGSPAPAGLIDWFKLGADLTGRNIIKQDATTVTTIRNLLQSSNYNGVYEVRMEKGYESVADGTYSSQLYNLLTDAVWARDYFGGTGGTDSTAYVISSKNGQDPIAWGPGAGNVLGKTDLIDIGAHMFREVDSTGTTRKSNLWFTGLINRAEPGGAAYMDFEFFVNSVNYNKSTAKFNTGGPDMGHTSFLFDANGKITRIGDVLFNVSLEGGGTVPGLELRIWMKRTDYNTFKTTPPIYLPFVMGANFDGAGTNSAYGYASISKASAQVYGYVNVANQKPSVPPFGTKNTKSHVYLDSTSGKYLEYSVNELAANMTDFGIDHYLVQGYNRCNFPWRSFMVKTRSSASFTASLKDFIGPLDWGVPKVNIATTNDTLSCSNPQVTLTGSPYRTDVTYQWSTDYGNIVSGGSTYQAVVNKAGKYYLTITLPSGCKLTSPAYVIVQKSGNPPITAINSTVKPNCNSQNNGSITISVTGGTPALSYSWTGPSSFTSTSKDLTSLATGSYNVTVTDAQGCQYSSSNINVPAATSGVSGSQTNVSCYSGTTGSINITATGTSPYTYSWSNGKKIEDLTNIGAGSYTVNVTDSLGCTSSASFTITQPSAALSASIAKTNDSDTALLVGNGTANLTVSGGTSDYTYAWTGPSGYTSTSEDLTNLKYGSYSVIVTDANGCTATANTFIYEPERCDDTIDNDGDGLIDCNDPDCSVTQPVFTGDLQPCTGDSIYYTISSPVAGYTYTWAVPSNATIISGQGTSSLYMKWNTTAPGQVCVTPQSAAGCSGSAVCKTVSPKKEPATPTIITKS